MELVNVSSHPDITDKHKQIMPRSHFPQNQKNKLDDFIENNPQWWISAVLKSSSEVHNEIIPKAA